MLVTVLDLTGVEVDRFLLQFLGASDIADSLVTPEVRLVVFLFGIIEFHMVSIVNEIPLGNVVVVILLAQRAIP